MQASDLAQQMSKYGKEAAQGDFSNHNKAAALAKVLASVTMANMIPVSGACLNLPALHAEVHGKCCMPCQLPQYYY